MLKAIIFDFDGVILESVESKTDAFRKLFKDYPKHIDRILDYHMLNGGISRFEKFKVIYRDILKKDLTAGESQELGRKFTDFSYGAVLDAPFVEGAFEFLKEYHQEFRLFVASGTPEDEMVSIVKARKLGKYFKGVYGSPRTKHEIVRTILNENRLSAQEAIFVGDSINDYEGASLAGVGFVGRIHKKYASPFTGVKVDHLIDDLKELEALIREFSHDKQGMKK